VSGQYPAPVPPFCASCRAVSLDDRAVDKKQAIFVLMGKGIED